MEIKKNHPFKLKFKIFKKKEYRPFLFFAAICVGLVLVLAVLKHNFIRSQLHLLKSSVKLKAVQVISSYKARPEKLVIDIKYEDYLKIEAQRDEAVKRGILISPPNSYVNAKVGLGKDTFNVKVRLKGLLSDHWRDDAKWSLKFQVKGGKSILGLTDFALMHPRTRNYIEEWLYSKANKREGIIAPQVFLVDGEINGKDQGVYLMVENVSKKMIEGNKRREGPVVYFSQDILIREWERGLLKGEGLTEGVGGEFFASPVVAVNQGDEISTGQPVDPMTQKAITMLEKFREGKLTVSQTFDMEKLTKYLALRVLFASSSFDPNDTKFYYNPISGKLEPIGVELSGNSQVTDWWVNRPNDRTALFLDLFFKDPEFVKAYIGEVEKVSKKEYLDKYFADIDSELQPNLDILYSEFPDHLLDKEKFYRNQEKIREVLEPIKAVQGFLNSTDGSKATLEIGNLHALPIRILGFSLNGQDLADFDNLVLAPKKQNEPVAYQKVTFNLSKNINLSAPDAELKTRYQVLGASVVREDPVFNYKKEDKNISFDLPGKTSNISSFNFLSVDEANKKINMKPGNFQISRDLVIPKGYSFVVRGPATIDLINSASIFSYSAVKFIGSQENPILITSSDSTGQGIAVINAKGQSDLNYVSFDNLSNPMGTNWALTGAITFYQSPVYVQNSSFSNNRSEDSINIVGSNFFVDNSAFSNSQSDAIDVDFGRGTISNSLFNKLGNDAIDVSDTQVNLKNINIDGASDKGISAGEGSEVAGGNVNVKNSFIGIASKDISSVELEESRLENNKYGLCVYQKKPEYGPAKLQIHNLVLNTSQEPYLLEKGSSLAINYVDKSPNKNNIYTFLYGGQ